MAMDLQLGCETIIQMARNDEEREALRLTWWAAVLIDRINSWGTLLPSLRFDVGDAVADELLGTGRPIAIADNQVWQTRLDQISFN